ncbi:two-component system, OmpR family, phosphate regulon sensor histidine kinase PhoR [Yoonia tamlensis]|uniref:histidine kinase n=1 Tax=Yoonia tamlensis TaxID=390270 RepID=A0A1I6GCA6_9RHOB|nr:ATP-binding protein [Yoonia tamlensis]SFR39788.1 two-component system, OmpR family, phosphate regulon sensor histidine kinase PhoR [Yoonia tamlensis]
MVYHHIADVISALPIAVLVISAEDRVRATNPALEAILGPNLVGKHYISALRQPGVVAAITTLRAGGGGSTVRFISRDGDRDTVYRVTVAPADQDIVLSFEDQTAAEEAGKMRRDFVANVSHELRTPLTALMGFIETLGGAARNDPNARDRFLQIMEKEAARMTRLVDDLLSLSRVEEDERVRPRAPLDVAALLGSVIKALEPQVAAANVTVALHNRSAGDLVPGDAGQLVQVFTNLVENAIKYGAAGGKVDVTIYAPADDLRLRCTAIQIAVADYGEGIESHHIARLTERFYRVDSHRSRAVGGTGLGLAIVKHIVNRHRGRLQIESEIGKGTVFSIFLPIS